MFMKNGVLLLIVYTRN